MDGGGRKEGVEVMAEPMFAPKSRCLEGSELGQLMLVWWAGELARRLEPVESDVVVGACCAYCGEPAEAPLGTKVVVHDRCLEGWEGRQMVASSAGVPSREDLLEVHRHVTSVYRKLVAAQIKPDVVVGGSDE